MRERSSGLRPEVVGREDEVARLGAFLDGDSARALLLTGDPGIGKTTLWEAGVDAGRERGLRVLVARPSGADARSAFAGLADLLDGVDASALEGLPPPQLRALEVALLRVEPGPVPPEARAIALGCLNALRALAARKVLLVAVDDVQWLDSPSADALAFAARRLDGSSVRFLLARRPGRASGLERPLGSGLQRLEVGPLSLGAVRHLLFEQLGLSMPRPLLRRLVESTAGNPLFALEVGRTLLERGLPGIGEELPVPDSVEDQLGTRVARLPVPLRKLLLALALGTDLDASQLAAIAGVDAVEDAVDAGLLLVDEDRVRASHPLFPAAARKRSRSGTRRKLHLELAGVVADEESRARHLALGTVLPDAELAATVARAAAGAAARGAREDAVELAGHALRLTPVKSNERADRLLEFAEHLDVAGEPQRVVDLLLPELDGLPPGETRVRALLLLTDSGPRTGDFRDYLGPALAESGDDPKLRAYVLPAMSIVLGVDSLERMRDAEAWALEALPAARAIGRDVERLALDALGWARGLRGLPIEDLCERFHAVWGAAGYIGNSPDRIAAQRLAWRGEVDRARTEHGRLLSLADERGEATSYAVEHLHLCELELRSGDCEPASRLLDEWNESLDREILHGPSYERCRALLAVARGRADEAEEWAAKAIASAETSSRWDWLEALRARGVAALLVHEPARAVESMRVVWEHTQREGVGEPGAFPVAPDLVEALVERGELAEARAVTDRLRQLAEEQEHPWGLATAKRCEALLRLGLRTDDDAATVGLAEAAADYGELGLRFDRARTLLLLGRAQRRRKKWAAARSALEQAAAAFEEIGSPGWLEEVRSELARVGARRPAPAGELSSAERRVAELAAEGLANKEIARTLFVSVKTVEAHLSHAYAKLGVRSRAQLARLLGGG